MNKGIPAKYVTLNGTMTVAGMSRANLDAVRDECELHLHQETGGVVMTLKDATVFISPMAVSNVELEHPMQATSEASPSETPVMTTAKVTTAPKAMLAPLADDKVEKGARNLADEVLNELKDDTPKSQAAARRRRK